MCDRVVEALAESADLNRSKRHELGVRIKARREVKYEGEKGMQRERREGKDLMHSNEDRGHATVKCVSVCWGDDPTTECGGWVWSLLLHSTSACA